MLGRAAFLASIVLMTAFAGCIGGKDDPVAPEATNESDGLTPEETTAPNGLGDISAFKETNKTETGAGAEMHAHDYWQGRDSIVIHHLVGGLIPFPLTPCNDPNGCTVGGGSKTYPPGTTIADFDIPAPPEAGMVYEGTNELELMMVEYTGPEGGPGNPAGKVFFDYLAANDEPGAFRTGGELKLNEPFKIPVEPTDADMPHQTKSLWIFRIYSNSEMGWFQFNISITAKRGYDVVNWPPHPDLYADKPDRILYDGPVKTQSKGTLDSNVYGSDATWFHPERVISWGTDRVEVQVSNVKFTSETGAVVPPDNYVLEYHNASKPPLLGNGAQYGGRLVDAASDGTTWNFVIDLTQDDGRAYDTPYAQYSRWGFRFVPKFGDAEDTTTCPDNGFVQQFLVGCQWYPWTMEYTMKITAYGHSTAGGTDKATG